MSFLLLNIFLIIIGFILLIKGADFLVDGASNIAKKFHIPEIIIGLTIVSIGTSMPELFVSITSAKDGFSDMAVGNVIGSNICNLLLILGLSAIIKPVLFQKQTKNIEIPMSVLITIVFGIFANTNKDISTLEAIILIFMFLLFIIYTICSGLKSQSMETKKDKNVKKEKSLKNTFLYNLVLVIGGIIALKYGGDFVVDGSVFIAKNFNVSDTIISLTILAVGTSLPELVTSVTAAIRGNSDIAIGNIIGSNIFNILLIIGVSALIKPITYNVGYNIQMIILMLGMILLFMFPFIPPKDKISRNNGFFLLGLYAIYMVLLFVI